MNKINLMSIILISIGIICWCVIPVSALSSAVIGETVHLSGKGGGYDDMYLFLTGPNLEPGGVRLDSVTSPVVSGTAASFTHAPVRSGVWEYVWDTGRTGGTLDPGTYLVWAVPEPLDRYDLQGTSYATINIRLTNPGLTAEISGDFGNGSPEETVKVTAEETGEEITSVSSTEPSGDEEISGTMDREANGVEDISEDALPQPTTAGSFPYPFVCAAGIGIFFLQIMGIRIKL
ncbi:hypothetical protein [Methanogenium organophilum]|uniref:DUF3821 domain-containing protein n=1 Tax=Methanogenium organophilum TaxID=2199 RepID=A0A9X9S341_METOG|nr:hypothetical protein [Methanogenium organophilum]WAI00651.1 hypothetical protein OU421_09475 [Methanogenium organophilum]